MRNVLRFSFFNEIVSAKKHQSSSSTKKKRKKFFKKLAAILQEGYISVSIRRGSVGHLPGRESARTAAVWMETSQQRPIVWVDLRQT